MNLEDISKQCAIKVSWDKVSSILSEEIKKILGHNIQCQITRVEDSFWSVTFIDYRLPLPKLCQIVQTTQPTLEDWEDTLPDDGGIDVNGIGMVLSEKLVARHLKLTWKYHLITEDSLWLVGIAEKTIPGDPFPIISGAS